jgi:hypothetical protein
MTSFDGEFADRGHSYAGRGGIRFSWRARHNDYEALSA